MIDLTRLNGHRIAVNCDLFKYAEASPDTTITLITGEKLIVRESLDQLISLIAHWRSHTLHLAWPDATNALAARDTLQANLRQQERAEQ
jgi:flagellar protein FlbD